MIKKHFLKEVASCSNPVTMCLFNKRELHAAIKPVYIKLSEAIEAKPFINAVDKFSKRMPDYYKVIVKPMNLTTICTKLLIEDYNDPWEFVDDVWQIFENAWLYHKKTTKTYKSSIILSEIFKQEIDPVMRNLGYCCGQKYRYKPKVIECYYKRNCKINANEEYFIYEKDFQVFTIKQNFCAKCIQSIPNGIVKIRSIANNFELEVEIEELRRSVNIFGLEEEYVSCKICGRKNHQICVLYNRQISRKYFVCDTCQKEKQIRVVPNIYTAQKLPITKLGMHIENRVKTYLNKNSLNNVNVIIRVLSNSDKRLKLSPLYKNLFHDLDKPEPIFEYNSKAIFAFQIIDGVEIFLFAMYVEEFGSDSAQQNKGRIYLSLIDSVHYFTPREHRTSVYQEIIFGYLEYVKTLGFIAVDFWCCPPMGRSDYIFYRHPTEQKFPSLKRLRDWYINLLKKGVNKGIIHRFGSVYNLVIRKLNSLTQVPYYPHDNCPESIEKSIQLLQFHLRERNWRMDIKSFDSQAVILLQQELVDTRAYHFSIQLSSKESTTNIRPIQDPDPFIFCSITNCSHQFIKAAKRSNNEFSSLRRVKYTTMNMLYEIHKQIRVATSQEMADLINGGSCSRNDCCYQVIFILTYKSFYKCLMEFIINFFYVLYIEKKKLT